jgi:transcription initiation factor IIF auxiliary subunit
VTFKNYSLLTEKKYDDDWYEWCIFVDSPAPVVNEIEFVEYRLHPTFPDPIREIRDFSHRFVLMSSGWGTFTVHARVRFKDGSITTYKHHLDLSSESWPRPKLDDELAKSLGLDAIQVYEGLIHDRYRWRKPATIVRMTGFSESRVADFLEHLASRNLVRKASWKSIDNSELWGATSIVGELPKL